MPEISRLETNRLSTFKTKHEFLRYGEFRTVEEFLEYRRWARENGVPMFIVGNGSNTLFTRRKVRTLVLLNKLDTWLKDLGDGRVEASSSIQVMKILRHCEKNGLDSFYFLASVPATVGGALAMNAGLGAGPTIFEFVESVTYIDDEGLKTVTGAEIERKHRTTAFTGLHDKLIVSAIFRFTPRVIEESEIRKRVRWCNENQDIRYPNCGSVFKEYHRPILTKFRAFPRGGIRVPGFRTQFSRRVNNWIICNNKSSRPIVFLIRTVQAVHRLFGKKATPEIIEVG